MGLIPQTKCSRCDRKYSGLRSRCPFCGARRRKKGKRAVESDNSMWKMIIGVVLLVVLIAAVVVLLVTSTAGNSADADTDTQKQTEDTETQGQQTGAEEGVNSLTPDENDPGNQPPEEEPEVEPEPEDTPAALIQSAKLMTPWGTELTYSTDLGAYDFTLKPTEELQLSVKTVPEETGETPVWTSSDESIFIVLQSGKVTGIAKGEAELIVTVGNITLKAQVRVR